MTDDNPDPQPDVEMTRLSCTIQLGDGIDRRGDVTVEVTRELGPRMDRREREVELPDGSTTTVTADDQTFGEFVLETGRATELLRDRLRLDEASDEE